MQLKNTCLMSSTVSPHHSHTSESERPQLFKSELVIIFVAGEKGGPNFWATHNTHHSGKGHKYFQH